MGHIYGVLMKCYLLLSQMLFHSTIVTTLFNDICLFCYEGFHMVVHASLKLMACLNIPSVRMAGIIQLLLA